MLSIESRKSIHNKMIGNTNSKGKMIGRILINNGIISKQIYPNELEKYLDNGWRKGRIGKPKSNGRKGKIRISNEKYNKYIYPNELSSYEEKGWYRKKVIK